jgi:hypothetical protein
MSFYSYQVSFPDYSQETYSVGFCLASDLIHFVFYFSSAIAGAFSHFSSDGPWAHKYMFMVERYSSGGQVST